MIRLEKNGLDWKEWNIIISGKSYNLFDHGMQWSEDIYNFSPPDDIFPVTLLNNDVLKEISKNLSLFLKNKNGYLGKYIADIFICTNDKSPHVSFKWEIEPDKWEGYLNPFQIRNEVKIALLAQTDFKLAQDKKVDVNNDDGNATICFDVEPDSFIRNFDNEIKNMSVFFDKALRSAEEKLSIGGFANKIVTKYSFSPHSKQAYTSYLLYFIEFLRDLGIEAHGDIVNKGNEILFSVVPTSKEDSLARISQALSFYLNLSEISADKIDSTNINPVFELKIEKLKSEIDRLNNNLRTAEVLIKYQEQLILKVSSTHEVINHDPKNLPSALSDVYIDDKKEDKSEFLGGGVKLGVYKIGGLEINWNSLLQFIKLK